MRRILKILGIGLTAVMFTVMSYGQVSPDNTLYLFNKSTLNPAFPSIAQDIGFSTTYFSIWGKGIDGAPMLQLLSFQIPVKQNRVAVGMNLQFSQIGVTQRLEASLSYSYNIQFKKSALALGLMTSASIYRVKFSDLRAQSNADPYLPEENSSWYFSNYGIGALYHAGSWYVGLSVPELLNRYDHAREPYFKALARENYRSVYLSGGGIIKLTEKFKFSFSTLMEHGQEEMFQGELYLGMIFFDRVITGGTVSTEGSFGGFLRIFATSRLQFSLYQQFDLDRIQKYNAGAFMVKASYNFVDKNRSFISRDLLF